MCGGKSTFRLFAQGAAEQRWFNVSVLTKWTLIVCTNACVGLAIYDMSPLQCFKTLRSVRKSALLSAARSTLLSAVAP